MTPEADARPLVSVIVASYNYERYLPAALESALAQDYAPIELVVCDDGSTDSSLAVANELARRDPRVRVISQQNAGAGAALNAAYASASGAIVCLLDADDTFLPGKVTRVVRAFKEDADAGLVLHGLQVVDGEGAPLYQLPFLEQYEEGDLVDAMVRRGGRWRTMPCSALSLSRSVADLVFPIPTEFSSVADGFVLALAPMLAPIRAERQILGTYRLHGRNLTSTLVIDGESARRSAESIANILSAVNKRLAELGRPQHLSASRNVNIIEQSFVAALCGRAPSHSLVRRYFSVSRSLAGDDLFRPSRKAAAVAAYGLALMLPARRRAGWLTAALGPRGIRNALPLRRSSR